jgi:hypothetical protein
MSKWYQRDVLLFEMVKLLRNRELAVLYDDGVGLRNLAGYARPLFIEALTKVEWEHKPRFYSSIARIPKVPFSSWDFSKRADERDEITAVWREQANEYDFVIDMDGDKAYEEAKILKGLFDKEHVPYSLNFSGSRGFHFRVEGSWFNMSVEDKILYFACAAEHYKDNLGLSSIDLSIYKLRSLIKLPYSIDGKSGLVVLPLTDEQFNDFDKERLTPENVFKELKLYDRGSVVHSPYGWSKMLPR